MGYSHYLREILTPVSIEPISCKKFQIQRKTWHICNYYSLGHMFVSNHRQRGACRTYFASVGRQFKLSRSVRIRNCDIKIKMVNLQTTKVRLSVIFCNNAIRLAPTCPL